MANQNWVTLLNAYGFSGSEEGVAYKESKVLKDISPGAAVSGQALTIPGQFLIPGNWIRYTAQGFYSTKAATKPTFKMGLYFGGTAGKALATVTVATIEGASTRSWRLEATSRIIKVGESGSIQTQGVVHGLETPAGTESASASVAMLPQTSPQTPVTVNTAIANILTLGGEWGTESAENTLTVSQWLVEILN